MRLMVSESKNSKTLYAIKSVYDPKTKKSSSKVIERLGSPEEIMEAHGTDDAYAWAQTYIAELTQAEKEEGPKQRVSLSLSTNKRINCDKARICHGGYLFLQRIYHELGLHEICDELASEHKFGYDLSAVLSALVYGRILYPSSKLSTNSWASRLIEPKAFDLQHVYRALDVIAEGSATIQAKLYKNSKSCALRNDAILYYDCTNFYFEIEQEDGIKQYGVSKENRPNPIVEMGLFMDASGVPLAFSIHPGNTNEQITLSPLEQSILKDFSLSKFVVCTDAGLASAANRRFNDSATRRFVTTQSIKSLKAYLRKWALDRTGWQLQGHSGLFDITDIDEDVHYNNIYYKERWINDGGLEQRIVITYSPKYATYQKRIRARQVERAVKLLAKNPKKANKHGQNDYKRFISSTPVTPDGEIAEKNVFTLDTAAIEAEAMYDGLYGVATNLEGDVSGIIKVNKGRWEIEECFRIMKHELKSRPVYLHRDNRIEAHFATCFIALVICRVIEQRLSGRYSMEEVVAAMRSMDFIRQKGEGYQPAYERTAITDALHDAFGFYTDMEIVSNKDMRKIISKTKRAKG